VTSPPTTAGPAFDPPLVALFTAMRGDAPAERIEDLAERRAEADRVFMLIHPGAQAGVTVEDRTVPVDGGEIRVRIYAPEGIGQPAPCLFFIHGGGWFQGNLDTAEVECGQVARPVGCMVVSVEYRLAPEHPFPIPLDDCVAAYEWMLAHADELHVDIARLAIGGTSAGGNLAAAVCIVARDRGLPLPLGQLLVVPGLDLTLGSESTVSKGTDAGLTSADYDEYAGMYAGTTDRAHPLVSPLLHPDLSGLPPAVIFVAEHDPVRDDGERYLARLHDAGVAAVGMRVLAHFHGSWVIPITATSRLMHDLQVAALRRIFEGTLVP
jgi:acetyl esterase